MISVNENLGFVCKVRESRFSKPEMVKESSTFKVKDGRTLFANVLGWSEKFNIDLKITFLELECSAKFNRWSLSKALSHSKQSSTSNGTDSIGQELLDTMAIEHDQKSKESPIIPIQLPRTAQHRSPTSEVKAFEKTASFEKVLKCEMCNSYKYVDMLECQHVFCIKCILENEMKYSKCTICEIVNTQLKSGDTGRVKKEESMDALNKKDLAEGLSSPNSKNCEI